MKALAKNHGDTERVFLIGAELQRGSPIDARESLDELAELASTAGAEIIGDGLQKLARPHAATFIGKGKAAEFAEHCRNGYVDTVIFDDELSPAQTRNLERVFDCKVLDRTALILDIFAQRAQTREGKMQIEMAQLQHILPRLTRFWTHLSRQKGGIGMRGDGETQLEVDRRRILERNGLQPNDVDLFVSHQANRRIIQAAADHLGLPDEKVVINIDRYGNTTGATIPLALADALAAGRLKKGDLVLLASVGAGFTVGAVLLRWAY